MTSPSPQFITVGAGAAERRIATIVEPAARADGMGVMWLPGFRSEMTSTKVSALADFARAHGLACTRLDYSAHGLSPGRIEDGTIGRWLEEVTAVFTRSTRGPVVVVGSSMGGYLALLLLRRLLAEAPGEAARIHGLVLIAPAWDMTERLMWQRFPESVRRSLMETGVYLRPSHYGDGDYAITRGLIEEGRRHLIGDAPFDPGRPIRILHGLLDPDVPWEHTLDLEALLTGDRVRVAAVPDGEHRLSRPEDIALMLELVAELAGV